MVRVYRSILNLRRTADDVQGYQYAAYYISDSLNASVRHPSLARRALVGNDTAWESFSFLDYNQTEDDGHDMCAPLVFFLTYVNCLTICSISLGISHGDGTLHLGWDQHDNDLNYRVSRTGVATKPLDVTWSADLFGATLVRDVRHPSRFISFNVLCRTNCREPSPWTNPCISSMSRTPVFFRSPLLRSRMVAPTSYSSYVLAVLGSGTIGYTSILQTKDGV